MQSTALLRWCLAPKRTCKVRIGSVSNRSMPSSRSSSSRLLYPRTYFTSSYLGAFWKGNSQSVAPRATKQPEMFEDQYESDLKIEEDAVTSKPYNLAEVSTEKPKELRWRPYGPPYVLSGVDENGRSIYRPKGLSEGVPVQSVERIRQTRHKGRMRFFETIIVQEPIKDKLLDDLPPPYDPELDAPLDFSQLFTQANAPEQIVNEVKTRCKIDLSKNRDALIQAFESAVKNQSVVPMDPSIHAIGLELIELQVMHALTQTYPNLPHTAIKAMITKTHGPEAFARATLNLKLEPWIQLVPNLPLNKLPNPEEVCINVAANTYASLVGLIYTEHGFDTASQFAHRTLPIVKVTPALLKRLDLLNGIRAAKSELHFLLAHSRFPLPTYEMTGPPEIKRNADGSIAAYKYNAVVKSATKVLGYGTASSKARAEARAAQNALFNHWSSQSPVSSL